MHLLAPANPKELVDRFSWFKKPAARRLAKKGIEFGFELKGPLEDIKAAPALSYACYWGLHLPDNWAADWYYHRGRHQKVLAQAKRLAALGPDYAVLHGAHLLWQPSKKDHLDRYRNHTQPAEYLKVFDANLDLIRILKRFFNLKIENFPLYNYYSENGQFVPYTYLLTGIGRLNDLTKIKNETGVDILLDIEHLITCLNFLYRRKNYTDLPVEKTKLNPEEEKASQLFGFVLKKGIIPYALKKYPLSWWVKKFGANFYHLTGSTQDVIPGKKIVTHGPIKLDDKTFRQNLRLVLAQKPEVMVIETASPSAGNAWKHLRENETEISFNNLCQILLEEL